MAKKISKIKLNQIAAVAFTQKEKARLQRHDDQGHARFLDLDHVTGQMRMHSAPDVSAEFAAHITDIETAYTARPKAALPAMMLPRVTA